MEFTKETIDKVLELEREIFKESIRIEETFRINNITINVYTAFAIILSEKNKLTADRMKELAEVKQELHQLKAQQQIALNNQVMGQTPDNNVVKLLDRNGKAI